MDLLTAILACNLYTADEPLVRAIAQSNSHGNQYAVVDPTFDYRSVEVPPEPKSLPEAVARLADLQSKGGRPLLGLMQVRPEWMTTFGREVSQAFGVCANLAVGSAVLAAMDRECAAEPAAAATDEGYGTRRRRLPVVETLSPRRACVVRRYGDAIGMPDFGLLVRLELGAEGPRPARAKDGPILFAPDKDPGWGPGRIFVSNLGPLR